jgi:selenocysteine-specific elongation factor
MKLQQISLLQPDELACVMVDVLTRKKSLLEGSHVTVHGDIRNVEVYSVPIYLPANKKPLKNRTRIRFHTGTCEVMGNLILLETESLEPGETAVVQIRLEAPVACVKDDRYVIRSYSPVRTIAGGEILNPFPQKHKRFKTDIIDGLKGLTENDLDASILFHVSQAGFLGLTFNELKLMTNMSEKKLNGAVQNLLTQKKLLQSDKETRTFIHKDTFDSLSETLKGYLTAYHETNPLREGMPKGELKSKFPPELGVKLYNLMLNQLAAANVLVQESDMVRLSGHTVALKVDQAEMKAKILAAYVESGIMPPYFKALLETLGYGFDQAREVLLVLVKEKKDRKSVV